MSAIACIYHSNKEPVSIEHINGMMGSLQQYPADDVQVWHKENVFLGCHAQWITPESIGEQLPYYDYKRQLVITADAIIDNRKELFDLLQVDYRMRKNMPDSQLILLAYDRWGEDSPKYLVGDFAFIIWDEKKQTLFGARDFSGTRTLYYYHHLQKSAFCTTIMPLLTLPYLKKQLNEQWLAEYLVVGGMVDTVDDSLTPYKNINQVPPSHSITITGEKVKLKRYCTLQSVKKIKLKSDGEYVEAFQEVFQRAVDSRLRTHLNVGAQLSGGLDSGAVVSFAAKTLGKENNLLHTFSYMPPSDFKDFTPKYFIPDEREYIKSTVNYVGGIKDHYYDFEEKNSYSEIDELLEIMEMPYKFFENSFWLKGMFEKANEEGVGILLNGDRGNFTVSWGSALDYYSILLKKMKWISLFQELNQYSQNAGGARLGRVPDIARIGFPIIDKLFPQGKPFQRPKHINPEFALRTNVYSKFKKNGFNQEGWFTTSSIYEERKRHFEHTSLWNAGNTLSSKLSLRYSLWKRDPTNDIRVIKFCLSVPEDQYVQNGVDRALIRRSTEKFLPDEVRLNQKFRGVQGVDWVHRMTPVWGDFREELQELSKDKKILEFLDSNLIKKSLLIFEQGHRPELATNSDYKILMRSIIIYRFINNFN
ncbi:lasso peptide isopeptide bond-forming cyclase [Peribacillus psychrosaccharolyticus]|uniref:lasso peptide isopeptide bond-forming cyclase n=1 Tax=Peribacillus psychrosaccharolyticus TaxID=1407 RepID=UPI003D2B3EA5